MEIKKLLSETDQDKVVEKLKSTKVDIMKWSQIEAEYNPQLHPIVTDPKLRKQKKDRVAKITYGLQKLATRRMTQMAFSIPVNRIYNIGKDETRKAQAYAIEQIYKTARINSHNMKRFHAFFAACEICTVWFPVKGEAHSKYGFETKYEIRCKTFSPMSKKFSKLGQANLYPLFDDDGKLIAISFEYSILKEGNEVSHFLTYYQGGQRKWENINNKWVVTTYKEELPIKKIPAIYLNRPIPIWEDTSENITEIELTLSQERDIIKKNSAPLVKITGKLVGDNKRDSDSPREVYQLEGDGDVAYVTWDQQIEAMKFMVDTLKQNIEEELQLPNLSLENVKGLGAMSGEARKTLLTDAHLKVGEESGDIIEMLEREFNVIKHFLSLIKPDWKDSLESLECEHVITPFIQNDEAATIDKYIKATGGKAIMSQRTAITQSGLVDDADDELELIKKEDEANNMLNMFPPAE